MTRRLLPTVAGAATAALLASCTPGAGAAAAPCAELQPGHGDSAITVLTDQPTPAFLRVVNRIADDPDRFFDSPALHLEGGVGAVSLATYDAGGDVRERATFDLAGVGNGTIRRRSDAKRQAACLRAAAADLRASGGHGGDLLRSLPAAAAMGRDGAEGGSSAVIALGLARSGGDGFRVATADLSSAERRGDVFRELDRYGLVPDLRASVDGLVLLDPTEGAGSGITAAGIRNFAGDLCRRLAGRRCTASDAVAGPRSS